MSDPTDFGAARRRLLERTALECAWDEAHRLILAALADEAAGRASFTSLLGTLRALRRLSWRWRKGANRA